MMGNLGSSVCPPEGGETPPLRAIPHCHCAIVGGVGLGDGGFEASVHDVGLEDFLAGGVQNVGPVVFLGEETRVELEVGGLVSQADDGLAGGVGLVGEGKVSGGGGWAVLVVNVDGQDFAGDVGAVAGGGGGGRGARCGAGGA